MYLHHSGRYADGFTLGGKAVHIVIHIITIDDGLDCSQIWKLFGIHSLRRSSSSSHRHQDPSRRCHPQEALGTSILGLDQNLVEHFSDERLRLATVWNVAVLYPRLSLAMFLQLWLQRGRPIESCLAYSGFRLRNEASTIATATSLGSNRRAYPLDT